MANKTLLAFIVPHREGESTAAAVKAAKEACAVAGLPFKMLSVTGNNPTKQRNLCIEKLEAEYIYFLDNDTLLTKEALEEFKGLVEKKDGFSVLGGPVFTPDSDSFLQKCIGFVFGLPYVVGNISSRYSQRGFLRDTNDSELILCNLLIKGEELKAHGSFNEKLYPNEENELIYRLKNTGHRIIYSPKLFVLRSQRESIGAFIRQILVYGRGRGEQTKVSPKSFSPALLLPLVFPYLFVASLLAPFIIAEPIYFYFLGVFFLIPLTAWLHAQSAGIKRSMYVPLLVLLTHMLYGFGFISGFTSKGYTAEKKEFECKITEVE